MAGDNTCRRSRLYPLHSAGSRNNDALHIFNDISAGFHPDFFRHFPQNICRKSGPIGNRYWFRTPKRRHQLPFQNLKVFLINTAFPFHLFLSSRLRLLPKPDIYQFLFVCRSPAFSPLHASGSFQHPVDMFNRQIGRNCAVCA